MSAIALARLTQERRNWRKDHPYGFEARPKKNSDGSLNVKEWECAIPGKEGTPWEGGLYKLKMSFRDDYPTTAPSCVFNPVIFHPNIGFSGNVCLSILGADWNAGLSIKAVLIGLQDLLNEPNIHSPLNSEAARLYYENVEKYKKKVQTQAKEMRS